MRSPLQFPCFDVMLADLPNTKKQISKHLGVTESTLAKYAKTGNAPRAVLVALFWETRWGRSTADTEAANWGALYFRESKILKREIERMAGVIFALEKENGDLALRGPGAANSPIWAVR
jgi:hypothetical protein